MATQSTFVKSLNSLKKFDGDDFSASALVREICWTLSRSLDESNQYSIPATIRKSVGELRDMLKDDSRNANSTRADKKMQFIQNLEMKQDLYKQALKEFKVAYNDLIGSEFKYTPMKANDEERRDKGVTKQAMDELLKKYG